MLASKYVWREYIFHIFDIVTRPLVRFMIDPTMAFQFNHYWRNNNELVEASCLEIHWILRIALIDLAYIHIPYTYITCIFSSPLTIGHFPFLRSS